MGLYKKPRRKLTEEDYKKIETMCSLDMSDQDICNLLNLSDTWFNQLIKKDNTAQFAKRLGRSKARLKVKQKFWQQIENGNMRAIELWLKAKEGYQTTENVQLSGPNGKPIETKDVSQLTDSEIKERFQKLKEKMKKENE